MAKKKLYPQMEADVLTRYAAGETQASLAEAYNCSMALITQVLRKYGAQRKYRDRVKSPVAPPVPQTITAPGLSKLDHLRAIANDESIDPKIRLVATLEIKELEAVQVQSVSQGRVHPWMCPRCREDLLSCECSLMPAKTLSVVPEPSKPLPVPVPMELSAEDEDLLRWAEMETTL